jgi:hypothetical protein
MQLIALEGTSHVTAVHYTNIYYYWGLPDVAIACVYLGIESADPHELG